MNIYYKFHIAFNARAMNRVREYSQGLDSMFGIFNW